MRFESRILHVIGDKPIPDRQDFPRWPMLCLNTERIFDAIRNGDLSFGKNGITSNDPMQFDDPDLTVRHVDLKLWMSHFYPDQKPAFLFDVVERQLQPASAHCLPTTKAGPESASALYGQNSLRQGGIWTLAIADCNCSRAICSFASTRYSTTSCQALPCSQSSNDARGSTTSNRVSASSDSTRTLPPCASTIDLTMASPSPAPSPLRCRDGSPR